MANGNNANIGFEKQIWDAACVLWGHIPAAEYRKVIVGLIFLRYISSAFEKRYQELVAEGDGFEDDRDAYVEDNIFFVPEDARWSKIASSAHTPEIGTVIDDAMRAIEKENTTLKNVLPKNYASPDLDKRVLGDVVDLFTNMDMGDTEESKDLLGRTYEYCIQQFAAYEGVKGGEFYTPASIVKTIVAILKPFKNCRVYDPCCGSGGMFVQSAKFIQAHSGKRGEIAVYGQESNADTWKMAKMNMAIRGIDADFGPYQADTFFNDLHKTLKADFIMANPPFNLSNWGQEKLKDDVRWKYGTPPAGNANYAWIQHMATIKNFDRKGGFKLDGYKEIIPSSKLKESQHAELFDTLVAHTDLTQNAEVIGNAELVMSKSGYDDIVFSMDLVKVLPKKDGVSKFLIAAILQDKKFKAHCLGYVNGTTVLHLSKKALPEYKLLLPSDFSTLKPLDEVVTALYKQVSSNISENTYLEELRESLLPKLMSGELDVSNIEL